MHLRKRGDKWYYRFYVTDANGKRKLISRVGGKTREAAAKAGRKLMAETIDEYGFWDEPEKMSFGDFLDLFMEEYAEINLRPATVKAYRGMIENHIKPVLGEITLQRLTPRQLQNFLNSKRHDLSRSSLSIIKNVLRKSLSYAVETCRFVGHNAAASLTVPPADEAPKKTHVFSDDEIAAIFRKFPKGHSFHMPIALAYYTGMRLGECLSLKWSDVDMDTKTISIHSTMYDDGGAGIYQNMPKTKCSIRTIPISDVLIGELKAAKAYQAEQKLAYGKYWQGSGYVCTMENGKNLTASKLRYFGQFCRAEFKDGSFHSLRHTHATKLLESGLELELVSKRLGHSTISLTAKVYSHVLENRTSITREVLEKVFDVKL